MSLIDEALRRAQAAQGNGTDSSGLRVPLPLPDPGRFPAAACASRVAARSRPPRSPERFSSCGASRGSASRSRRHVTPRRGRRRDASPPARRRPTPRARRQPRPRALGPRAPAPPRRRLPSRAPRRRERPPRASAIAAAAPAAIPATAAPTPTRAPAAVVAAGAPPPTRPPPRRQPPVVPPPAEISYASGSPRIAVPGGVPAPAPRLPRPLPRPSPARADARARRCARAPSTARRTFPRRSSSSSGIVYSDSNPTALISGHVVRPGELRRGLHGPLHRPRPRRAAGRERDDRPDSQVVHGPPGAPQPFARPACYRAERRARIA